MVANFLFGYEVTTKENHWVLILTKRNGYYMDICNLDVSNLAIVIFIYRHYPFDQNAKSFETSIKLFCILIKGVMPVYENYTVIAFKSCIKIVPLSVKPHGLYAEISFKWSIMKILISWWYLKNQIALLRKFAI